MNVKKFFWPDKLKATITTLLLIVPLILQFFLSVGNDVSSYGFPFSFIYKVTYQCGIEGICPEPHYIFNGIFLVINLLLLYIITLFIIFLFEKFTKQIKNNITKRALLGVILFLIFTIISYIFPISSFPSIKTMTEIGSPLGFYAYYDSYTSLGIKLGSLFLWEGLIIDIIFWYILSTLIIYSYNKYKKDTKNKS